jgi:copper ion binding protein
VGFLIATPQTGVDSFFVSASMLGWPFALFKVFAALVTGMAGGLLTNTIRHRAVEPPESAGETGMRKGTLRERVQALFEFGFVEILGGVAGWMVIGVLLAGLIGAIVPENYFSDFIWMQGLLGMLIMLAISLPMYVCAVASVPIAYGLVQAGMPLGAALVFLMAGPASNVATVGAIFKAFGARVVGIYVGTVAVLSVLLGWFFQTWVLGKVVSGPALDHEHRPWWAVAAALALIALLAWHIASDIRARLKARRVARMTPGEHALTFAVRGMDCGNCVAHVTRAIEGLGGVDAAYVDLESGEARVVGRLLSTDAIVAAVGEAGYEIELLEDEAMNGTAESTFSVQGMTCKNCVAHVTRAIEGVDGVEAANVDLETGRARVLGHGVDPEAVVAAVTDAGYAIEPAKD